MAIFRQTVADYARSTGLPVETVLQDIRAGKLQSIDVDGELLVRFEKQLGDSEENSSSKLTPSQVLFDLEGRVNRARFLAYALPFGIVTAIAFLLDIGTKGKPGPFYYSAAIITFWPSIALNVKRCHDLGYSGWLFLLALVPFVNILYAVMVLFIKGTEGNNKYGPDPLGHDVPGQVAPWQNSSCAATRNMKHYFIAKTPASGFVGQMSIEEVVAQLNADKIKGDYVATEYTGPCYANLVKRSDVHWEPVSQLVARSSLPGTEERE